MPCCDITTSAVTVLPIQKSVGFGLVFMRKLIFGSIFGQPFIV